MSSTIATKTTQEQFQATSGATDAVWIHTDSYNNRNGLGLKSLNSDIETDTCIVGSGIAGVSIAYELVSRGKEVVMLEARNLLSGETGRTSGHLSNVLDDGYPEIQRKHGKEGAQVVAESHAWAIERVGEVSKKLGIDCEYRKLPEYDISQYDRKDSRYNDDIKELRDEAALAKTLGIPVEFNENLEIKGWSNETGRPDQRGGIVWHNQATFHPTKYVVGVLKWLINQPNFRCYPQTRVINVEEKGIEVLGMGKKHAEVSTQNGQTVRCQNAVEATNVPLQKLAVVAQMEYNRTYCIAIRVPKGSIEDCLINDSADAYKYIRFTACDEQDDYLVIGGCDHDVGQEDPTGRFEELETWVRERFPQAKQVDYKWSGQVFDSVDGIAYIGLNQGNSNVYIVSGDSGHGLTHGVLAGKLIADEIEGKENPWASVYSPKRVVSVVKSAPSMIAHDLQINAQYKRFVESDIKDIEDLSPGCGGVMKEGLKSVAVYKDENGKITKLSAMCPHLQGVVCFNKVEKTWDCPVHGSRFSKEGVCIEGPAKAGLSAAE